MADDYENLVLESAETRRDLDTIYHPMYGVLKKIFVEVFPSFTKTDFKKACDLIYYQGGYPKPTSPPKAEDLADYACNSLRLLDLIDKGQLKGLMAARGIEVTFTQPLESGPADLDGKKREALETLWGEAGIEGTMPIDRKDILRALVNRAQALQSTICHEADTIKIDAAQVAEDTYKIKKKNFVSAVRIAATKLRKGEGRALEQIEKIEDEAENFSKAVEPLRKTS